MGRNSLLAKPLLHEGNIMEVHMGFSPPAAVVAVDRKRNKNHTTMQNVLEKSNRAEKWESCADRERVDVSSLQPYL